jgi:hypothetical protein
LDLGQDESGNYAVFQSDVFLFSSTYLRLRLSDSATEWLDSWEETFLRFDRIILVVMIHSVSRPTLQARVGSYDQGHAEVEANDAQYFFATGELLGWYDPAEA